MTSPQPDPSHNLATFLRRYHPLPPPPAPELESRVMQVITPSLSTPRLQRPWLAWLGLPTVLAACCLGWLGYQKFLGPSAALTADQLPEASTLEAFLANTWHSDSSDVFSAPDLF